MPVCCLLTCVENNSPLTTGPGLSLGMVQTPLTNLSGLAPSSRGKYLSVSMSPYLLVRVLGPWLRMPASTRYL
ncbi:hypothetical protein DPMN_029345 [Dreissena polymorpha]|uniref:Uncharacterized protein n=1 Tax=Dreissena polymorpha TaxID=45954 RepID=A0A9D4LWA4_DREPO|nr:hypothetical protein DPMN_029345 [Dreissena polymorpha]